MAGSSYDSKNIPSKDASILASIMVEQVNKEDIASMVYIQRDMLSRFEKTNEMLINFNILSTARYEATVKEFSKHTHLLYDMKRDLDSIFKRIRVLKQRLGKMYPEAFAACSSVYEVDSDDDDDDDSEAGEAGASSQPVKDSLKVPSNDPAPSSASQDSLSDKKDVYS